MIDYVVVCKEKGGPEQTVVCENFTQVLVVLEQWLDMWSEKPVGSTVKVFNADNTGRVSRTSTAAFVKVSNTNWDVTQLSSRWFVNILSRALGEDSSRPEYASPR